MDFSSEERLRRYKLIRDQIRGRGLAGLIVFSDAQITQQGLVRYFTNFPIPIYSHVLLFFPDDDPIFFTPSPLQTFWAKKRAWIPEKRIEISKDFGQDIARIIKSVSLADRPWGVISLKTMPARDYIAFRNLCPKVDLIESIELLEDVRCQKSTEELNFVQHSAELAQMSHRIISSEMKKGLTERKLVSKVEKTLKENGAERTFCLISSNPNHIFPYTAGDHVLDGKSPLLFSTEVSGSTGYWTQMVRTFFWSKPTGILLRMVRVLQELRSMAEEELRPGRRISEVAENFKKLIQERGFEFGIHFGHGLGLDVVEEPLINVTNHRVFMPNQIVTIHPHLVFREKSLSVWLGDTYLIKEEGSKILTPYSPTDF